MTRTFQHHLAALPPEQRDLWPALRPAADLGFVLYGGTAIALRLGHRASVDFDFFTEETLDREALSRALPFLSRSEVFQDRRDSWGVLVGGGEGAAPRGVKLSFFGGITFGRVDEPAYTSDRIIQVASLTDLLATKLKVQLQRASAKDYQDVAAILRSGVDLARGLSAARTMFGANFQPAESLKALTFFGDGDLGLVAKVDREALVHAATSVRELPPVALVSPHLRSARHGSRADDLER
jgi:hypothetical protein